MEQTYSSRVDTIFSIYKETKTPMVKLLNMYQALTVGEKRTLLYLSGYDNFYEVTEDGKIKKK